MHTYQFEKWSHFLDIDECAMELDGCSDYAACFDTEGSYICFCNDGYTGDGTECTGVCLQLYYLLL